VTFYQEMHMGNVLEQVQDKYAAVARSGLSTAQTGVKAVAEAFGYSAEELASIPAEANMGLSCGNPLALAHLKPGETVVDLGSGGGLDIFLAAQKVGPTGKAIGIDMTADMIALAQKNAARQGLPNVEFHLAQIDALPLPAHSVDCLISNCVLNLAPDKPKVFREMFRVLKPGGRVAVSDIALKKPLPPEISQDVLAYVGCIAGAILITDYAQMLQQAGFTQVQIIDQHKDLKVYEQAGASGCCTPAMGTETTCCGSTSSFHSSLGDLLNRYDVNDYAASVSIYALKTN
jgi:arsenite methyltransferase